MITDKRAREIASLWYGGQWSALYKIVCNDDIRNLSVADLQSALYEISEELYAFEENKLGRTKKEKAELLHLKIWLTDQLIRRYQSREGGYLVEIEAIESAIENIAYRFKKQRSTK